MICIIMSIECPMVPQFPLDSPGKVLSLLKFHSQEQFRQRMQLKLLLLWHSFFPRFWRYLGLLLFLLRYWHSSVFSVRSWFLNLFGMPTVQESSFSLHLLPRHSLLIICNFIWPQTLHQTLDCWTDIHHHHIQSTLLLRVPKCTTFSPFPLQPHQSKPLCLFV